MNIKNIEPWKEISRETAFKKYSRNIEKVVYRLPNGKEEDYYIKQEGPVVSVLALTKDQRVILAKQYRPGPNEILSELPGGVVEASEEPIEAMRRELLEETGYEGTIQFVGYCYDDAYSTINRSCFVATDCIKVHDGTYDANEFIELVTLSIPEFRELLRSGKMTDVEVGYLCLDYLGLL